MSPSNRHVNSRHVEEHVFIALLVSGRLKIPRTSSLDLYATSCLLLDMLYVSTSMSNDLGTQIEPMYGLQADRDLLFGPFTLHKDCQYTCFTRKSQEPYSTKLVTFNLLLISTAETPFIDKLREFLLDQFVDLGDSGLQARLARACDVKVQRRIL
jgi:hypothetical protein